MTTNGQDRIALVNGRIVLPDRIVEGEALVVEGGSIGEIVSPGALADDIERIDVGGRYITPGLVDIHIHGGMSYTFNDPTPEAFGTITEMCASRGVTSVLATIATAGIPALQAALQMTRDWMAEPRDGAQVLGAHLEGPYFALEQAGAQDPKHVRNPDDGTVDSLLEYADAMRMMSFAPELPGALELTERVRDLGIVPAGGHSAAFDTHVEAAVEKGLRHAIHLWSGQSSTIRQGPWRRPGILEATLASDNLTGEIISDNRHLPPTLMRMAYKALGPDRLCIISDATSGAGLPEGSTFVMGEMEYEVHDGVGMLFDRTAFAGSTSLMNKMVDIVNRIVGVPLVEAVRMATLTPSRVIGVDDRKGSLEQGKDADIVVFEDDFTPWRVMIGGNWVHGA